MPVRVQIDTILTEQLIAELYSKSRAPVRRMAGQYVIGIPAWPPDGAG